MIIRLIISAVIIFAGGFSIGMLLGLYIGEREERNDKHKRFNKNKRIWNIHIISTQESRIYGMFFEGGFSKQRKASQSKQK